MFLTTNRNCSYLSTTSMMTVMELLVVAFLIGIGPLALLFGADSREDDPRGWWPGAPRRPAPGLPPGGRYRGGRSTLVAWAGRSSASTPTSCTTLPATT